MPLWVLGVMPLAMAYVGSGGASIGDNTYGQWG